MILGSEEEKKMAKNTSTLEVLEVSSDIRTLEAHATILISNGLDLTLDGSNLSYNHSIMGSVQCSAVQCSAVQCSAVQCSAVQ